MKDHVTRLKLSKRMAKLGWKKSHFSWVRNPSGKKYYLMDVGHPKGYTNLLKAGYSVVSAPIASEIWSELPYKIEFHNEYHFPRIWKRINGATGVSYRRNVGMSFIPVKLGNTPQEALGLMWEYLKKEGLI